MISKLAPIAYRADAACPTWLAFLEKIFAGKRDLIAFVQRAIGYSLTGSQREQVIFILYGTGANGKSTLLDVFRGLVGDYGQTADFSSFAEKDKDVVRNDLADLAGSRLVTAAETRAGERLDEATIKKITGGDPIKARFLFREHFSYLPMFKVFLATNHRPVIRGGEYGIWRRIHLVPFEVTIPAHEQDHELTSKLRSELPGILTWALAGCLDWQRNRLGTSEDVSSATEEYRENMDVVSAYLKDRVVQSPGARVTSKQLYEDFCEWVKEAGETAADIRWFGRQLNDKGIKSYKSVGVKVYKGMAIRQSGDLGIGWTQFPSTRTHARTPDKLPESCPSNSPSPLADPGDLAEGVI
jgi:putative DNA primase/helicase